MMPEYVKGATAYTNAKWCLKCGLEGLYKRTRICPDCGGTLFLEYHDREGREKNDEQSDENGERRDVTN